MTKWLPWKFIVKHVAQSRGFIDPVSLYAQIQRFSQPSEVAEPVELLRAGVVMHARGLLNSKIIQHNLDWVWPYWIERQFDPADVSFLPRAFSVTHINLTHRNWSAIGVPGVDVLPIVDPRGLLTPNWDGWSLDAWMVTKDSSMLLPSRTEHSQQSLIFEPSLSVHTSSHGSGMKLTTESEVCCTDGKVFCRLTLSGKSTNAAWLVLSARPYNPEGVSFIDSIKLTDDRKGWLINGEDQVHFSTHADRHHTSIYSDADVYIHLLDKEDSNYAQCPVGMATAAAMFRVGSDVDTVVTIDVPLRDSSLAGEAISHLDSGSQQSLLWQGALKEKSVLSLPDKHIEFLYNAAVHTLILCSPGDVYAGPYTYKRFWYRDAVFVAHGLLSAGLVSRTEEIISRFPNGQKHSGYFHSQEGEWDSNGEVLWIIAQFCRKTNVKPRGIEWNIIKKAAEWIIHKRMPDDNDSPWSGLLPAGFSAEHLGPNDYYYWDNYWSVAGLESAAWLAGFYDHPEQQGHYRQQATTLLKAIDKSLDKANSALRAEAIPAAPTRRMDAGAIGSLVSSYPLQVYSANDIRVGGTVDFLLAHCFYKDGFFQDMIHSGINAYLTMHVAQVLLRRGDPRYFDLIKTVASIASPTGHWPEAVHPGTGGGCMGDGHHAWAAAEWIAMLHHCFVRQEGQELIIGSGIPSQWLTAGERCSFGQIPTVFGTLSIEVEPLENKDSSIVERCRVSWNTQWHHEQPEISVAIPGYKQVKVCGTDNEIIVEKEAPA